MSDQIPIFPDITPSSITRTAFHVIENDHIQSEADLDDLIGMLHAYPEREFYLFHEKGKSANQLILGAERAGVIIFKVSDLFYYRHPKYVRNYVRIHREPSFDWQREVVEKGPMYIRTTLGISETVRRQMDLSAVLAKPEDKNPVIFKPTFHGIGIDIPKAWRLLKANAPAIRRHGQRLATAITQKIRQATHWPRK